jgi:hypothetical protein
MEVNAMRIENNFAVKTINQAGSVKPQEPTQPQQPLPPPGGNIENRKPPQKPAEPHRIEAGGKIDTYA